MQINIDILALKTGRNQETVSLHVGSLNALQEPLITLIIHYYQRTQSQT